MPNVVVLGLGKVGSRNAARLGHETLSHVGAIMAAGGYEILALVDPDGTARRDASRIWGARAVGKIVADTTGLESADLVVVAGAGDTRATQIDQALKLRPKVLLVEKPLAADVASGRRIVEAVAAQGATLRVNFNRRFDPGHAAIKARLAATPRKIVMRYGKGLRNYASHMIDLLLDWFGQVDCVQAFGDSPTDDGPLDFRCRMTSGFDAVLLGMNGLGYDQFEIDLFFADHRLELADGGVVKRGYGAVQGRVYAGYTHLTDAPEILHRGIVGGFVETYRAVGDFLATGKPLGGCGPKDALAGLAIIDAALASARSGGKAIDPNAR